MAKGVDAGAGGGVGPGSRVWGASARTRSGAGAQDHESPTQSATAKRFSIVTPSAKRVAGVMSNAHHNSSVHSVVSAAAPNKFSLRPARDMSVMVMCSVPNTIALGTVATGSMKAQLALSAAGIIIRRGS